MWWWWLGSVGLVESVVGLVEYACMHGTFCEWGCDGREDKNG